MQPETQREQPATDREAFTQPTRGFNPSVPIQLGVPVSTLNHDASSPLNLTSPKLPNSATQATTLTGSSGANNLVNLPSPTKASPLTQNQQNMGPTSILNTPSFSNPILNSGSPPGSPLNLSSSPGRGRGLPFDRGGRLPPVGRGGPIVNPIGTTGPSLGIGTTGPALGLAGYGMRGQDITRLGPKRTQSYNVMSKTALPVNPAFSSPGLRRPGAIGAQSIGPSRPPQQLTYQPQPITLQPLTMQPLTLPSTPRKTETDDGIASAKPLAKSSPAFHLPHLENLAPLASSAPSPLSPGIVSSHTPPPTPSTPPPAAPTLPTTPAPQKTFSSLRLNAISTPHVNSPKPGYFVLIFPESLVKSLIYVPNKVVLPVIQAQCNKLPGSITVEQFNLFDFEGKPLTLTEETKMENIQERTVYLCLPGQPWIQKPFIDHQSPASAPASARGPSSRGASTIVQTKTLSKPFDPAIQIERAIDSAKREKVATASDIIDFLVKNQHCSTAEAITIGKSLQGLGYLTPRGHKLIEFYDGDLQFNVVIPAAHIAAAQNHKDLDRTTSNLFSLQQEESSEHKFAGRTSEQEEKLKFEREREERSISDVIKRDWDTDIWAEPGELNTRVEQATGEEYIESCSLNGIIQHLTQGADIKFLKIFIITYKSFATPSVVLRKLMQRFHVPDSESEKTKKVVQISVVNAFCHWLELASTDWDPDLVQSLQELILELLAKQSPLATKITKALDGMMAGKDSLKLQQARIIASAPPPKLPKVIPENPVGLLLNLPTVEIARQLTLLDWGCFSLIRAVEFLDVAWTTPKLKYRSENVLQFIQMFNQRSNWVSRIILIQKGFKVRVKMYSVFVELAKELFNLHNFSSCIAIMSGLNNAAVFRLKHTKAAQDKKTLAIEAELNALLDHSFSHKNYREALGTATPPAIPHLGVFLGDLVFIEEGNPDILHTNLINFRKRQLTFGVIRLIQGYQLQGYALQPVSSVQATLAKQLDITDDKKLFELSLAAEPRDFIPPK